MRTIRALPALMFGAVLASGACETDSASEPGPDAGGKLDAAIPAVDGGGGKLVDAAANDGGLGLRSVQLRFKARVGSAAFACGQSYPELGLSKLSAEPVDFRLFVQDVFLITKSGTRVPLQIDERPPYQNKDVALLDFTTGTGACADSDPSADSNTVIEGKVPAGEYTGISFSNGVPESLNHGDVNVAPQPLKARGANWSWVGGYRFVMAGVRADVTHGDAGTEGDAGAHTGAPRPPGPDAGASADASVADASVSDASAADAGAHSGHGASGSDTTEVHVGSMGCSGTPALVAEIACTKANRNRVELSGFDPTKNTIVADLAAVFADVDLSVGGACHSSGPICPAPFAALGIDIASGNPVTTQTVFRVE